MAVLVPVLFVPDQPQTFPFGQVLGSAAAAGVAKAPASNAPVTATVVRLFLSRLMWSSPMSFAAGQRSERVIIRSLG
ncbi:hypothetical protein ADK64_12240 [Streptomyces sp. MMG1121]|nr:hypothetical protein ADK64_12240 [Streptomyces sp. MMG1121]